MQPCKTLEKPSDYLIEKVLLGEASAQDRHTYIQWVEHDPEASKYVDLKKQRVAIGMRGIETWQDLCRKVSNRPERSRESYAIFGWKQLGFSAAFLLLVSVAIINFPVTRQSRFVAKGSSHFSFILKRGAQIFKGHTPMHFMPGDTLQFYLFSPQTAYYAVLYSDDNGPVQPYFPSHQALKYEPVRRGKSSLPNSIILDAGGKKQNIYAVAARRPFTVAEAKKAIEQFRYKDFAVQVFELRLLDRQTANN
ncbi:MAG: hypothetical protein GF398_09805 [Chitinivibrionales bacterium]|nr:hypothetical protein [Chitinivibrionales bacterium]